MRVYVGFLQNGQALQQSHAHPNNDETMQPFNQTRYNDSTLALFMPYGRTIFPMTTHTDSSAAKKAYRQRVGLVAELPNFPGPWNEVMEKIKIADELGFNSIWLAESWGYELFTSMTDIVRVTRRIQIGA